MGKVAMFLAFDHRSDVNGVELFADVVPPSNDNNMNLALENRLALVSGSSC
jgi:hypothetical protein